MTETQQINFYNENTMFKKIISIAALCLAVVCMNLSAQGLQSQKFSFRNISPMFSNGAVTSQLPLNEDEYWWGYFDGSLDKVQMIGMGGNSVFPQTYLGATCIPAGTKDMDGKSIQGMSFSFPSSKNITDVKIWISTSLPATAEDATEGWTNVGKVTGYNVENDQINEVRFDKPYTMDTSKDIYVGYQFTVSKDEGQFDQYPVFTTGEESHPKGLMVKVGTDGEWADYQEYGFGDLAVRMLMGGGKFEKDKVEVTESFGSVFSAKNTEASIPMEVKNMGGNGFTSLGLTIDIAGSKQEVTFTPDSKVSGIEKIYAFDLKVNAPAEIGTFPVTITIDKVNGVANNAANNKVTGELVVISRIVERKVLFEEFTATWCGFCPRGAVGLEKAEQVYGDNIVPIAVHYQDEMDCTDYYSLVKATVGGFPGSHINRTFMDVDPYFGKTGSKMFGVGELIDQCMAEVPYAEVIADATIDGDVLIAKSDVRFLYSGDIKCAVGYVITADSLYNDAWWQGNNYSGAKGLSEEPLFDKWVNADKKAKGVVYNDVAITAIGVEKGANASLPTTVVADEPNVNEVKFNLNDYPIIQDRSKLNLCVYVIDRNTGRVVNADKKALSSSTGIENVTADGVDATETERYTIDGRRIYAPEKGVNIVKYSDGHVKKIVVR